MPASPSMVMVWPWRIRTVPLPVPSTAGMPYSLATMEPCAKMLPMSVTKPAAWAKRCVHAGVVSGLTRIVPGRILSNSDGPNTTLAGAVTRPELTGKPRIVALASSFLICVSLKAMPGIWLASAGNRAGRMVALARFPKFASCGGRGAEFRQCCACFGRSDGLTQLRAYEVEGVVRAPKRAARHHAPAQFERHRPQDAPCIAEVEGDFFAHVVVAAGQPQSKSELPVLQAVEKLRDFGMFFGAHGGGAGSLPLRVVVLVLHHAFQRGEQRGGILDLRRFHEIHAVALMSVGL